MRKNQRMLMLKIWLTSWRSGWMICSWSHSKTQLWSDFLLLWVEDNLTDFRRDTDLRGMKEESVVEWVPQRVEFQPKLACEVQKFNLFFCPCRSIPSHLSSIIFHPHCPTRESILLPSISTASFQTSLSRRWNQETRLLSSRLHDSKRSQNDRSSL